MGNYDKSEVRLKASGLCKAYRLKPHYLEILCGAAITVRKGEKVAIVGRSGAGKSTLLHVLGALDSPDSGSIEIDGVDLGSLSGREKAAIRARQIGFVFQSYNLLHEMDIVENVMLPAMASTDAAVKGQKYRDRAVDLLEKAGVGDRLSHMPLELSGGEQQRVAIARALMNEPRLVLADEPTGNLDDITGRNVLDMLFSLADESGASLVIVTHNEKLADACDRKLRLENGVLV
jgi:predicted ABC-type transport system involved in lysophospholipase L1 biosynthesis ATPase subunit